MKNIKKKTSHLLKSLKAWQMQVKFSILIIFLAAVSAQNDEDFVGISGGIFAKPGQFPFQAALLIKKESSSTLCGGSIISEVWIITAAHCLDT